MKISLSLSTTEYAWIYATEDDPCTFVVISQSGTGAYMLGFIMKIDQIFIQIVSISMQVYIL